MTRRAFASMAALAFTPTRVVVPLQLVLDGRAKWNPEQIQRFWSVIWPEALRDFGRCGIEVQSTQVTSAIRRSPSGQPVFTGLARGAINLVITDQIPIEWDSGRGLAGVTTRYQGYHLCLVALRYAHPHEIPFVSVNTCMHELLHALLHDIFESRPKGLSGMAREARIDLYATCVWLFRDGAVIRESARRYVRLLRG